MSDMVQQPVIQLVQELTMTAVVEQHDCTDTKEKRINQEKVPGPVWIPIMHLLFILFQEETTPAFSRFTTEECLFSQSHAWARWFSQDSSDFKEAKGVFSKSWGGKSPPLPPRLYRHLGGRRREKKLRIQTGPTQLVTLPFVKLFSDTSEICWHWKVIIYIYKEPEVLQTNTCFE